MIQAGSRERFLDEVLRFVRSAATLPGVLRIALIGSILTDRPDPKDVDVLVSVTDDAELAPLAALGRRLQGRLQSLNHGADVFLADGSGRYLGRTCSWKACGPGIRPVTRYIAAAGHTSMTIWPPSGSQGGSLLHHRSSSGRLSCAGAPCQPTSNGFLLVLANLIGTPCGRRRGAHSWRIWTRAHSAVGEGSRSSSPRRRVAGNSVSA